MSRSSLLTAVAISLAGSFASGGLAAAQELLLDIKSPVAGADASNAIAIGDWDGDGTVDLAIGAYRDGTVASLTGAVRVHSGKDGSVLTQFFGANADDYFGLSLARMPDLDGDGVDDLAVGAILTDFTGTNTGSVYLYAGRSGTFLRRIDGSATATLFGTPLGAIDDVDGDGICDLFVANFGGGDVVHVHSGADGHEITSFKGKKGEGFGFAVSTLDDLDGDGVKELLVGAKWHVDAKINVIGAAHVISTATGTVLRTHLGTFNNEYFGYDTAALGDLDGDGVHDYAVSTRYDDHFGPSLVFVYSGATGAQLAKITAPADKTAFFVQVRDAGDVNGDGVGDLAIGGYWTDTQSLGHGAAFLVSGRTLRHLDHIDTPDSDVLLAPMGDLDGDGFDDLIVGSTTANNDGEVRVYSGDDLWLSGTPGEVKAGDPLELATREGAPGALTVLALVDVDGSPTFQLLGGLMTFGATGESTTNATVPPGLAGHRFTFRAHANDAAGHVIASAPQAIAVK